MKNWNINRLSKNRYMIKKDNDYIEVLLSTKLSGNPEILLSDSRDMSSDYIIFFPKLYATEESDMAIIGEAYQYAGIVCIGKDLVSATIINTNIPDTAKASIELLFD